MWEGYTRITVSWWRYSGAVLDPNAAGQAAVTGFFFGIVGMNWPRRGMFFKAACIAFCCFALGLLMGSGSRGALVGLMTGLAVYITSLPGLGNKMRYSTIAVLMFMSVALFVESDYVAQLFERISIHQIKMDRGAGRLDIWWAYLSNIMQYGLTGTGLGYATQIVAGEGVRMSVPHNTFLDVLVEFGLVGFFLFIMGLERLRRNLVRMAKQGNDMAAAVYGLFGSWLGVSFFLDTLAMRETWIVLGCAAGMTFWPAFRAVRAPEYLQGESHQEITPEIDGAVAGNAGKG